MDLPELRRRLTVPNLLTLLRLALVPVLLVLIWKGQARACFWTLAVAFGTDLVDGPLARRLGQVTAFGASLDSISDLSLFLTVLMVVLRFFLGVVSQFALLLGGALLLGAAAQVVSLVRFRRPAGFHTWLAKATGALAALAVLQLLWTQRINWLAFLAFLMGVLAQLEQLAIALTLRTWQSDMRSWWHLRPPHSNQGR